MKKIVSILLTLALLLTMLPMAMAADEYTSGYYTYTLDSNGNAAITKYSGKEANLTVPSTLDGHPVTGIRANAAKGNQFITNLTLPSGLLTIGTRAFGDISSLKSVFIPKTLDYCQYDYHTDIGAFAGCSNLNTVTFETGATQIPANLFHSCNGLTEITIPDTVTTIDRGAFAKCQNLKKVTFSKNLTSIDVDAFNACPLTDVVLPTSLTFIGAYAFGNISSLKSVFIPKSLDYCQYDFHTNTGAFAGCDNLNAVSFETGATQIPANIFNSCNGLTEITIPDTVTTVERGAFANCRNLKKVTFSKNLTSIGVDAFQGCTALSAIDLPECVKSIDSGAFKTCPLTAVVLPTSLTFIGSRAFGNISSLESVFIPKSLDYCQYSFSTTEGAFEGCNNLNTVSFETGITQIPANLFNSCNGLTEITIPNTVTIIERGAFGDCRNLSKVTMQDSVTTMEGDTFTGCVKLRDITLSSNLEAIPFNCFKGCSSLAEMAIPESVTRIGGKAFGDCTALKSIDLGRVIVIDNEVFYNCDALTSVTIPGTVTKIGNGVFAYCEKLSDVKLSVNISEIPSDAFFECPALKSIVLPFSVKKIHEEAFANCTALTDITIPRYTTSIASNAFSYPSMLTIYGVAGTRAESYAGEIGASFVAIDKATTSLTFNRSSLILNKGETFRLIPEVAPFDFTGEIKWESSDKNIATVDAYGLVKAVKNGSATITFTAGNRSVSCIVTVGAHTHSFTETIIQQPTCTEAGQKKLSCACGQTKTETIPALGHQYVNGTCTRCGETDTPPVVSNPYTDVSENMWYYPGVMFAYETGLMNGMGNNTFQPDTEMNRAMLVTVMWRYAGSPVMGTNSFTDVPNGTWYTQAVAWASHTGIVNGVGHGRFDPEGIITREQLVTLVYRYCTYAGFDTSARTDLSVFPDQNKISGWATTACSWAVAEGLLKGTNLNGVIYLDPLGSATRSQVATFFMRMDAYLNG